MRVREDSATPGLPSQSPNGMRAPLTNTQRAYYGAFVLSMVICWSPWKATAYFAPILAVIWFIWSAKSRIARSRALKWIAGWTALIVAYWALSRSFDVAPALLAIITYGTIGALYVIPSEGLGSPELVGRMLRLVALVVMIEATIGIAQALAGAMQGGGFDLSNGDVVQGTIYPGLEASRTFANPMFAANIGFMLIGLLAAAGQAKRWRGTVLLGFLAFVLASVMHAVFFLAAAIAAGYVLCRPQLRLVKGKRFLISTLCAVPVLTYAFLAANVSSVISIVNQALVGGSPRAIILVDSVTILPDEFPYMPLVGLGPGQFSSNAALLASGTYFGRGEKSLPLIRPQSSPAFSDFLAELVARARDPEYGGSVTVEPFFSWLSIYTEFGLPCLIGIFCWVTIILLRVRREALKKEERLLGAAVIAGVVFFVLLGFQADYWEMPQAVLVGALLIKAMHATLVGSSTTRTRETFRQGDIGDGSPDPLVTGA